MRRIMALAAAILLLAGNQVGGQPAKPASAYYDGRYVQSVGK